MVSEIFVKYTDPIESLSHWCILSSLLADVRLCSHLCKYNMNNANVIQTLLPALCSLCSSLCRHLPTIVCISKRSISDHVTTAASDSCQMFVRHSLLVLYIYIYIYIAALLIVFTYSRWF